MQEERRKIYTVVAIVVIAGMLLSCVAAVVAGGLAGFVAGRRQGKLAAERLLATQPQAIPRAEELIPGPEIEELFPPLEMVPSGMEGALIREVISGTPAADAGLEAGDIITAIDQIPVDLNHSLPDVIGQYKPGDRVTVHLWRAGEQDTALVELAKHPDDPMQPYLGVYFSMIGARKSTEPSD